MTLRMLIERLAVAKAGSPEFDASIRETVLHVGDAGRSEVPRRYTTSIDAALMLVPAGWSWEIRFSYTRDRLPPSPMHRAVIVSERNGMVLASEHYEAEAETPALALCIAVLRLHAAKVGKRRGRG